MALQGLKCISCDADAGKVVLQPEEKARPRPLPSRPSGQLRAVAEGPHPSAAISLVARRCVSEDLPEPPPKKPPQAKARAKSVDKRVGEGPEPLLPRPTH